MWSRGTQTYSVSDYIRRAPILHVSDVNKRRGGGGAHNLKKTSRESKEEEAGGGGEQLEAEKAQHTFRLRQRVAAQSAVVVQLCACVQRRTNSGCVRLLSKVSGVHLD